MENIQQLLYPESIAILGASSNPKKLSGRPLFFLKKHGFNGRIYPINPKTGITNIMGIPCYKSIKEIDGSIDQAIIALPAKMVESALLECAEANVKSVVLFSSGFAETGDNGRLLQEKIKNIAEATGIALCGPNCQGLINLTTDVFSSFTNVLNRKSLFKGNVGLISQSGALAGSVFSMAQKQKIGFSHWVSVGNEAVLSIADFITFMATDPATQVIATYVEGFKDVEKWVEASECAAKAEKPIIVLKTGRSDTGSKAITSHTGSVAGDDVISSAFLKKYGFIRVNDIPEMLDTMAMFSLKKSAGKGRVAILTSSGGAGILLVDALSDKGIELAKLSKGTKEILKNKLPAFATVSNPIDVTAQLFQMVFMDQPDLMKECIRHILEDDAVDILVIALTMVVGDRAVKIARDISEVSRTAGKPVAVVWLAGDMATEGYGILRENQIPLYNSATGCVSAIDHLIDFNGYLGGKPENSIRAEKYVTEDVITEADFLLHDADTVITEYTGRKILSLYNIPIPPGDIAGSANEAITIAKNLNYPLVLKIESPDILHKTDANCVMVNIRDKNELITSYDQIMSNAAAHIPGGRINGVLIEEMIDKGEGIEMIVGTKNDPIFGPAIVLGLGGIFVEVYKEVICRIAPLDARVVKEMVRATKGFPILEGVRGKPGLSIGALEETLINLSRFSMDFRGIVSEIDINPLMVLEEGRGVSAADILIVKDPRE